MTFDDATKRAAVDAARRMNVSPAALLAVAEVESGGKAFAVVNGRNEPLIRFEGHYFDRRITAEQQKRARSLGLSSPKAGAVKNPASQASRWKMLERAAEINRKAAYESTSWGMGQVMGAHWAWLGFASVEDLVALCRRDSAGQIELMARFIAKAGLADALRSDDWATFARAYNGPGYRANKYDVNIGKAFARWSKIDLSAVPVAKPAEKPASAPKPVPAPAAPAGGNPNILTAIIAAAAVAVGAAWSWLAGLPCEYLNLFCGG